MTNPRPVALTQVDAINYKGTFAPEPLLVVGPVPGGGGGGDVGWDDITDKPSVIGAGATRETARTAIGAGTSNVVVASTAPAPLSAAAVIGTSATAARSDHAHVFPTYAQVTAKPATVAAIPATLGTAGQVLAVNSAGTGLEWVTPA